MRLLVFGRSGQVATELARQSDALCLGRDAADLADPDAARKAIEAHAPDAVINAAAWTAVDKAEDAEPEALRLNAHAPAAMAQTCARRGIPFLHVSTDYVFDGSGSRPWTETDAPAPLGAYGRTKLAGEDAVRAAGGSWAILRTSWVVSAHGQNFIRTMLRLSESRDRLTIVADQVGGPTPADDIAGTLIRMASRIRDGQPGGLYHYAGQPAVSWADFARAILDEAGRSVAVEDIPTTSYPTPARRPLNSRLDCSAIRRDFGIDGPDWRAGLSRILSELIS